MRNMVAAAAIILLPLLGSCSVLSGNSYSDDPAVAAQQQRVDQLEAELKQEEQYVEQAKERQKAAEDRLKAAKHELEALKSEAKQRANYK
ncbi:hypothetical protein [Pontibacter chitinilyticus]|uniref:hypothetical protein n=1 Tax=Pontibacter chitinilyticus TaxID=2674989 RepID=UPI00321B1E95